MTMTRTHVDIAAVGVNKPNPDSLTGM